MNGRPLTISNNLALLRAVIAVSPIQLPAPVAPPAILTFADWCRGRENIDADILAWIASHRASPRGARVLN